MKMEHILKNELFEILWYDYNNPLFTLYPFSRIVYLRLLLHINVKVVCCVQNRERGRISSCISLLFFINK